jgi:hypothetical protein
MNSQDVEQIERHIIAELAPLKDRLDAAEAILKGQMAGYRGMGGQLRDERCDG